MTKANLTRRGALGAIAAAAAAVTVVVRPADAAPATDPIFAAIERHKQAATVWEAAVGVRANFSEAEPMTDERWEQRDQLDDAVGDAREPLDQAGVDIVSTSPTTFAGIIAAISYVRTQMRDAGTYMPYTAEFEFEFEYTEGCAGDAEETMKWLDAFLNTIAEAAAALDHVGGV